MTFGEVPTMSTRAFVRIAGVLGGLCWVGQAAMNDYDVASAAANALYWGGGVLVLVALVGLGAGLVSGASWLRLLVGLCVPLLVWSILEVLHAQTSDNVVDGGFGLALALVCAVSLLGGEPKGDQTPVRGGTHSK
jgi:hypothetical protein